MPADGRRAHLGRRRHPHLFSVLEVNGRDEEKASDYPKKMRKSIQTYTKSGGGGTLPVGLGQAGGGIFFIVDALDTQAKGYDVTISFPSEGIVPRRKASPSSRARRTSKRPKSVIDWAASPAMRSLCDNYKINFVPVHPKVRTEASLAKVLKAAKIFPFDDVYAGANRKRIVERWVNEVLNAK